MIIPYQHWNKSWDNSPLKITTYIVLSMQKYFVSEYVGKPLLPDKIFPPYALRHAKDVGTEMQISNISFTFMFENAVVFNEHNSGVWGGLFFPLRLFSEGGRGGWSGLVLFVCLF